MGHILVFPQLVSLGLVLVITSYLFESWRVYVLQNQLVLDIGDLKDLKCLQTVISIQQTHMMKSASHRAFLHVYFSELSHCGVHLQCSFLATALCCVVSFGFLFIYVLGLCGFVLFFKQI